MFERVRGSEPLRAGRGAATLGRGAAARSSGEVEASRCFWRPCGSSRSAVRGYAIPAEMRDPRARRGDRCGRRRPPRWLRWFAATNSLAHQVAFAGPDVPPTLSAGVPTSTCLSPARTEAGKSVRQMAVPLAERGDVNGREDVDFSKVDRIGADRCIVASLRLMHPGAFAGPNGGSGPGHQCSRHGEDGSECPPSSLQRHRYRTNGRNKQQCRCGRAKQQMHPSPGTMGREMPSSSLLGVGGKAIRRPTQGLHIVSPARWRNNRWFRAHSARAPNRRRRLLAFRRNQRGQAAAMGRTWPRSHLVLESRPQESPVR
jgi:hypothetical protein